MFETAEQHRESIFAYPCKGNISFTSNIHVASCTKTRFVRILSKLKNQTFSRKQHPQPTDTQPYMWVSGDREEQPFKKF